MRFRACRSAARRSSRSVRAGRRRACFLIGGLALTSCGGESNPQDLGPEQLTVDTQDLPDGDESLDYSAMLRATGGSGDHSWRVTTGSLPDGLTLDGGSGTLSGVPTRAEVATFTVEASDVSALATPGTHELSITVHSAPSISSPAPPGTVVGAAYAHTLEAAGGRGDYVWSIAAGTLPPGLSLDPAGSIGGTPTTAGTWAFTLRATSGPAFAEDELGISVCDATAPTDPWAGVDPWRAHQRNGAHLGYVPVTLEPCRFAHAWTIDFGLGVTTASQVVSEGGVVALTTFPTGSIRNGEVVGLDVSTGDELWRVEADRPGHPGIADGVVYVTSGTHQDAELIAIDAATGVVAFRAPFQNQLSRHLAPVVSEGLIITGGTDFGGVYAYDAATGDSVWAVGTSGAPYDWQGPAVTDSTVHVVNTLGSASLQTLDLLTGAELGNIGGTCNCEGAFPPMLTSPERAVAAVIGRLTSFDLEGGSVAWVREASTGRSPSLASAHGWVFSTADEAVEVLDEADGALVRAWQPPHDMVGTGTRVVVTDNLLFLSFVGQVHAVDLGTWEEVWHYPVEGEISLSEGMLFIHATDGTVVAIATS